MTVPDDPIEEAFVAIVGRRGALVDALARVARDLVAAEREKGEAELREHIGIAGRIMEDYGARRETERCIAIVEDEIDLNREAPVGPGRIAIDGVLRRVRAALRSELSPPTTPESEQL